MKQVHFSAVRRAAVDRADAFVLRRMRTLADRAGRGVGRSRGHVVDVLASGCGALWDRHEGAFDPSPELSRAIVDQFHRLYYHSAESTWQRTWYRGVATWKCPLDLWIYQEIIQDIHPDLIIETGTAYGGSALFLADLCTIQNNGQVVSIDLRDRAGGVEHDRLTKIIGSSTAPGVVEQVATLATSAESVLVVLDADHARDHVLAELRLWSDFVTPGSYLIAEDTNINGHPVYPHFGPGPAEAVETFLTETDAFVVDRTREKLLMTWNPGGFLRRIG